MSYLSTLKSPSLSKQLKVSSLDPGQIASLIYHDLFDFPLNSAELYEWSLKEVDLLRSHQQIKIGKKWGYFFIQNRKQIVAKRLVRKIISEVKTEKAKKYVGVLRFIPTIQMIGITGTLAMKNADENSDIDLMIITKKRRLWFTRAVVLIMAKVFQIPLRRFVEKKQKDRLCLNVWLDESDLSWGKNKRNIFTAHEIAQIRPLVNKDNTYEKFLRKNSWFKNYWPNAVKDIRIIEYKNNGGIKIKIFLISKYLNILISLLFESLAFKLQYKYMKEKITKETVTSTRALFHPNDWSEIIAQRLK